jgi:hypothetical protein
MSMFSRKLEAQLRFQGILWYWHFKTRKGGPLIEAHTEAPESDEAACVG